MFEKIQEAAEHLTNRGVQSPQVGVVLGTGLGGKFVETMEVDHEISYEDVPHFPISTVEFHHGKLIYGKIAGKTVLAMQGRFHYYEGYTLQEVTFPIRVMKQLGVQHLLISNASGNMNLMWKKGELMLIDDHINFLPL